MNLPNKLTVARILLVPVFMILWPPKRVDIRLPRPDAPVVFATAYTVSPAETPSLIST